MEKTTKKDDKSTWAIGDGLLLGIGVGFFPAGIFFGLRRLYISRIRSWSCVNFNHFKNKLRCRNSTSSMKKEGIEGRTKRKHGLS